MTLTKADPFLLTEIDPEDAQDCVLRAVSMAVKVGMD